MRTHISHIGADICVLTMLLVAYSSMRTHISAPGEDTYIGTYMCPHATGGEAN
jgi:hypothetical protein